ncbi:MAG TPA: TRAP transporter fused permease subunit [Falsiroseomonas sp.]|jgi:TRAP transporter 4TM/12TM fusion protein|nr:TRAP transporter fused permease subunit [Falsiroseomonas sp.]
MLRAALDPRLWVGAGFCAFQYWILAAPQAPLVERPAHLITALFLLFLWQPLRTPALPVVLRRGLDALCLAGVAAVAWYYWDSAERLANRIDMVDPVLPLDVGIGVLFIALLIEGVRRAVGGILVAVLLAFLLYGMAGFVLPGAAGFRGFALPEAIEILTMSTSGILGVTTETSVGFVFYFVAFGVVYSAIGGGSLFVDLAARMVGTARGGSAKVAIIGSSLMGTISGSAVANVTATGVFTIPLMRRSGIPAERAAATEAIASTGGQLMPPIMGVAAFVMAELLVIPYAQIALAGLIPALAFYAALFISADLYARRTGLGTIERSAVEAIPPVLPRLVLLAPLVVLIGALALGWSAPSAAMYATLGCLAIAPFGPAGWRVLLDTPKIIGNVGRQAAEIAVPIGAVGIVIAVAIQSNLALKFAAGLMSAGGDSLGGALLLVILGCIIMGMGLPTVAAYIIGAILFVPAVQHFAVPPLAAHFFVLYYCVLSMVTPPVALASYAAAGLAQSPVMATSLRAFQMSFVCFLIPLGFIADPALLAQGSLWQVLLASAGLLLSTSVWAAGVVGQATRPLAWPERALLLACGLVAILYPTGSTPWWMANGLAAMFLLLAWRLPGFALALPAARRASRRP